MMLIQNLGIFLEMNKVNLSFQRNNWQYLLLMTKFRLSSENENYGKLVSATVKLPNSPILKAISDETGGNFNKGDFLILKMKNTFNIWKSCILLNESVLPK